MKSLKNTKETWGLVSITIHWLTVIAVICMFIMGLWMDELEYYDNWYHLAPFIHKSVGICLFVLTVFRLSWRIVVGRPDDLPSHTKIERVLARLMHWTLYVLLFTTMVCGYLISTAKGHPVSVFGWFEVPATVTSIPRQADIAGDIHLFLACTLIFMAILHGGAAIKHHFVDKDATLLRMLFR